ncbi:hypothetical protein [Sporosarcina psychrophila]|uniref:hypothetical protein n=1 Tax=Sporosarcina psychrophila TaxID=1476 RepID=UPI00078EA962|nr:hypothetical protein [Sporosarcina psychrophila]AMQ06723.1 hypothetical protein AZE41_12710 [Sporosarcina psychrophila]
MNIQITNVNMSYKEGQIVSVQVFFQGHDDERTINLSGYVPLTAEEYAGNESIVSLSALVRQNVASRFAEVGESV